VAEAQAVIKSDVRLHSAVSELDLATVSSLAEENYRLVEGISVAEQYLQTEIVDDRSLENTEVNAVMVRDYTISNLYEDDGAVVVSNELPAAVNDADSASLLTLEESDDFETNQQEVTDTDGVEQRFEFYKADIIETASLDMPGDPAGDLQHESQKVVSFTPEAISPDEFAEYIESSPEEMSVIDQIQAQIDSAITDEILAPRAEEAQMILEAISVEILIQQQPEAIEAMLASPELVQENEQKLYMYVERLLTCLNLPADEKTVRLIMQRLRTELAPQLTHDTESVYVDPGTHEKKPQLNWYDDVDNSIAQEADGNVLGRWALQLSIR
jgi:hypothetical protein